MRKNHTITNVKRLLALALLAATALTVTACSSSGLHDCYEEAQLYLGCGECEMAARLFSQLGEYADSADYALYCAGLAAIREGELALARANLSAVYPFKSSGRYLTYLEALEREAAGDGEGALEIFEMLGSFENSHRKAEALRTAIPEGKLQQGRQLMAEGDYAAARAIFAALNGYGASAALERTCAEMLSRAACDEAAQMAAAGNLLGALHAYEALGDALDAPERAASCRRELHTQLQARFDAVTLADAPALMADYEALADDSARQKAAELNARYGVNLQLLSCIGSQPYVLLGSYPTGQSGLESALCWRVLKADGSTVTLLCESVIDAAPVATMTSLQLTSEESAAVTAATLPSAADLSSLTDLSCAATPYALAQGVSQEQGLALYWLRDSLESGMHPAVNPSGVLTLPQDPILPGIRPLITLSLENYSFTKGSGTAEDPFR